MAFASAPTFAAWTNVTSDVGDSYSSYVDLDRVKFEGGHAKIWYLQDFNEKFICGFGSDERCLSRELLEEFNCNSAEQRATAIYWFIGNMATGRVVSDNAVNPSWFPVLPGSKDERVMNIACKRWYQFWK